MLLQELRVLGLPLSGDGCRLFPETATKSAVLSVCRGESLLSHWDKVLPRHLLELRGSSHHQLSVSSLVDIHGNEVKTDLFDAEEDLSECLRPH